MSERKGKVQTVVGLVEPDTIGITHMHEHIIINYLDFYEEPTQQDLKDACCCHSSNDTRQLHTEKIAVDNLHWINYNYNKNLHNLELNEIDVALRELALFKNQGGNTIVEVTTGGIGRDPTKLKTVSEQSKLNIVMGAGYYVDKTIRKLIQDKSEQEIEDEIVRQLLEGADGTDIKAGIIGEVGCSWPLTECEKKSLRASARAQKRTGVSITIHPGRSRIAPLQILEIIKEAGGDLSRVVIGHLDRTVHDIEMLLEIAKTGCVLEYDLWGMEISYYPWGGDVIGMLNDNQRIEAIAQLIDAGHAKQIVVAHDVYTKHRLVTYGGHGYHHILHKILPRMKKYGISDENIKEILINTPKRLLTIQ
ncbi:phosphotriesterase-related protein [Heterostelium album PN500]|uniref:Phosphotriesterase-related protein n=1 Tax=Heterostelium pallidum (strain ATCC 26659 / Pp 5 / PN500) TaxID=670386 RepID=D3BFX8_HETP5|nr:phosphotriesterase-related protein [Heterostelium album PN500]EFA79738.1 phosphotriesterase-related protein [Heterostelium album PN500]|eukprot:XP_020431859.1 phosphotriesterase-related protein [Heterostelium album PN500]